MLGLFKTITITDAVGDLLALASALGCVKGRLHKSGSAEYREQKFYMNFGQGLNGQNSDDYLFSIEFNATNAGVTVPKRISVPEKVAIRENGKVWIYHKSIMTDGLTTKYLKFFWDRKLKHISKLADKALKQHAEFQKAAKITALKLEQFSGIETINLEQQPPKKPTTEFWLE